VPHPAAAVNGSVTSSSTGTSLDRDVRRDVGVPRAL
jgi:hypothetical protein